jgi:hypothetical protein
LVSDGDEDVVSGLIAHAGYISGLIFAVDTLSRPPPVPVTPPYIGLFRDALRTHRDFMGFHGLHTDF